MEIKLVVCKQRIKINEHNREITFECTLQNIMRTISERII